MSKREAIARYNLIIKKLRKHPSTFSEISGYLVFESELQEYNFNVSKRTFQRDLEDIRSIYNIDIQYDFSRKVYYIDDQHPEISERILEAFDTFNALNISDRLSSHIHFEKRRPQGTENMYGLLHAIEHRVIIKFQYQKFWEDEPSTRRAAPYALKEFKNRWYVLAKDLKDNKVKTFGLDRLNELEITKKRFDDPGDFDAAEYFRHCFGIVGPNSETPEEIILSFNALQGKFVKTLPLHHSQEIMVDDDNELRIKLTLYITHDLMMELLSYGSNLRVVKPISLIKALNQSFREATDHYS